MTHYLTDFYVPWDQGWRNCWLFRLLSNSAEDFLSHKYCWTVRYYNQFCIALEKLFQGLELLFFVLVEGYGRETPGWQPWTGWERRRRVRKFSNVFRILIDSLDIYIMCSGYSTDYMSRRSWPHSMVVYRSEFDSPNDISHYNFIIVEYTV